MVGRTDVDVLLAQRFLELGLHGLRLRNLLRRQALSFEHVHEVHVAAEVELVGPVELDPAILEELREDPMRDRGADLALDVVADDRDAGIGEPPRPDGVARDEDRERVYDADLRVDRALRVVPVRLLGPDREVADQHVRSRSPEHLDHVHLGLVGLHDRVAVVDTQPVESAAPHHRDAGRRHVGEPDRVVGLGEDRLGDVLAHLLRVDVERGDDLDVADVVSAELHVHQAGDAFGGVRVLVVLESLDEGRGAVAESDDGDPNRAHAVRSFLRSVAEARRLCPTGAVMPYFVRSCWINPASHATSASVAARPCSMSARW